MTTKTKKRPKAKGPVPVPKPKKKGVVLDRRVEIAVLGAVLLLTLGLRLIRIDSPLLDFHAHRQTQTASNTRGFAENTLNLFRPTFLLIDANGNAPGVTDMEFPIFQYVLGLTARVVGMHDFMGRLLSAFFGVGVATYVFLISKRYFGVFAGFGAAAFYAINPVAIFFNRTFQPDTMSLFAFTGGIYHLAVWFEDRERRQAVIAAGLTSLSLLIKPPVLLIIAPWILYEFISRKIWEREQRSDLLIFLSSIALIAIPVAAWYLYSYLYIFKETGLTMIRGRGLNVIDSPTKYWFSTMIYVETLKRIWLILTPIGAGLLAAALIPMVRQKRGAMMTALFIGYLLYFIGVAEYNLPHYYYQLPFIPIASIYVGWLVGWGVGKMKDDNEMVMLGAPLAIICAFLGIAWMSYSTVTPWYNINNATFILDAAKKTEAITGPGARIYTNNMFFGEFNYYSHSYIPYVRYSKIKRDFVNHDVEWDPKTGKKVALPAWEGETALGTKYVVWLKYQDWSVKDRLPEGSKLLADEWNFALWELPVKR